MMAARELVNRMEPPLPARSSGMSSRTSRNADLRFTASISSHCSSVVSSTDRKWSTAAQCTSEVRSPRASAFARAAASSVPSRSARSQTSAWKGPGPRLAAVSTVAWSSSRERSSRMHSAPASASPSAAEAPSPRAAPVTRTRCPRSCRPIRRAAPPAGAMRWQSPGSCRTRNQRSPRSPRGRSGVST